MSSVYFVCHDCGHNFLLESDECEKCNSRRVTKEYDEEFYGGDADNSNDYDGLKDEPF